jgi:hypothetical protein
MNPMRLWPTTAADSMAPAELQFGKFQVLPDALSMWNFYSAANFNSSSNFFLCYSIYEQAKFERAIYIKTLNLFESAELVDAYCHKGIDFDAQIRRFEMPGTFEPFEMSATFESFETFEPFETFDIGCIRLDSLKGRLRATLRHVKFLLKTHIKTINLVIGRFLKSLKLRRRFSLHISNNEKAFRLLHGSHPPRANAEMGISAFTSPGRATCMQVG